VGRNVILFKNQQYSTIF